MPLLEVKDLHTSFFTTAGEVKAVDGISFQLERGQILGIVGESGSGKTATAYSIMQILGDTAKVVSGSVRLNGYELINAKEKVLKTIRGNRISIIFQDPMSSLNPSYTIGHQIVETLRLHTDLSYTQARQRALELLRLTKINDPEKRIKQYPFEISGGMRQRIMIAIALACEPDILIADEPTASLDITIQMEILNMLQLLQKKLGFSVILITHDLGLVERLCDYVLVMYAGTVCEYGPANDVFSAPKHEYTRGLLHCAFTKEMSDFKLQAINGDPANIASLPKGCPFSPRCDNAMKICLRERCRSMEIGPNHHAACWQNLRARIPETNSNYNTTLLENHSNIKPPLCSHKREVVTVASRSSILPGTPLIEVRHLSKHYPIKGRFFRYGLLKALDDVSFSIQKGKTLGLVGESGCGKTTLGRTILHLYQPTQGDIIFRGTAVKTASDIRRLRQKTSMVFQDPYASLDPYMTVSDIIAEPLDINCICSNQAERMERISELMHKVGLSNDYAERYAHEFSGGQRQRIGIARALALNPEFVVCDEPISALDVSIQAQIINMFLELQEKLGLTYLFIEHDILVARYISDQIAVMYSGKIVELADATIICSNPVHPYTKTLISAITQLSSKMPKTPQRNHFIKAESGLATTAHSCRFQMYCPYAVDVCHKETPELRELLPKHFVACHLADKLG